MRVALVLGGAACVVEDVRAALRLGEFGAVVGCNDVGVFWPGRLAAWASLHSDLFRVWSRRRDARGLPAHRQVLGHEAARSLYSGVPAPLTGFTSHLLPGQVDSGSSGLFALKTALVDLAFDRAVLCGVPMDRRPRFFDEKAWGAADNLRLGWTQAFPAIVNRARSMSGWTADLLGRPDVEWVNG